jgi:2-dehydro-3-deoxyphosphogluconate aldolase/(4S)-4-hydroxy-2-oxoglutarate aldolase
VGVQFVPTGGIGPKNLHEYLAIDAIVAVGGSWMVPRATVRDGNFAEITRLTAEAVALLNN